MKNICELLNIEYPLIQGGMALIANHLLASAVSNAGGLGLIATGADTPEKIKEEIRLCKKLTPKPFGVNIMLMSPYAKIAQLVIDEGKVVTTGAGSPGPFLNAWKSGHNRYSGCSQRCSAKNGRSGTDIIVEGTEAGGHIGDLTTMALVPKLWMKWYSSDCGGDCR